MTNPFLQLKRQKPHNHHDQEAEHRRDPNETRQQALLPGLPDHVAELCLSRVPPTTLFSVCHVWRRLICSSSYPPILAVYALMIRPSEPYNTVHFAAYDPVSATWHHLPRPSQQRFLVRHPSYISRQLPVQSLSVDGKLVVVSGTDDRFMPALSSPLVFDPSTGRWSWGPRVSCPRRWCTLGALRGAAYLASGIGSHYSRDVARSVERWHIGKRLPQCSSFPHAPSGEEEEEEGEGEGESGRLRFNIGQEIIKRAYEKPRRPLNGAQSKVLGGKWERMGNLKHVRFCRDAIDAVGWRGRLCMVNMEGDAAKEGAIYDARSDTWTEMKAGMLRGWRGPATAMEEETLYVVDESKGILKTYDEDRDAWSVVVESEKLKGARRIAAARGGKVCVLGGDGSGITVVDAAETAVVKKVWGIDPPDGFQIIGIHILPRMTLLHWDLV